MELKAKYAEPGNTGKASWSLSLLIGLLSALLLTSACNGGVPAQVTQPASPAALTQVATQPATSTPAPADTSALRATAEGSATPSPTKAAEQTATSTPAPTDTAEPTATAEGSAMPSPTLDATRASQSEGPSPPFSISITPEVQTVPAGASTTFVVSVPEWTSSRPPVRWSVGHLPSGLAAEFLPYTIPSQAPMIISAACATPPGEYTFDVQAEIGETTQIAKVTVKVGERLVESQPGSFTGSFTENTIVVRRGGPTSLKRGPFVVLAFCESARPRTLRVMVNSARSDAGTTMHEAPPFTLFRSLVWPAPDSIQTMTGGYRANAREVARSSGWDLAWDITNGVCILAFERSPLEDSQPPEDRPASVSYRVDITRCCTLPEGVFRDIWQDDPLRQAELSCPVSGHPRVLPAAWEVQTSFQPFEHGAMIWSDHAGWYGVRLIFVLHPDGTYQQFFDSYDPDVDPVSGGESPPAGLVEPILGFGKVWRQEPGVREALGWATAPESPGAGRFQIFLGGDMIWLSQRQAVYTLLDETYTVVDRPSFEMPTPTPPSDATRLVNRWAPRYLRDGAPPASQTFAFGAAGALTLHNCTGSYELRGRDKVFINTDNCAAPELVTGLYEYAFEDAGDTLVLLVSGFGIRLPGPTACSGIKMTTTTRLISGEPALASRGSRAVGYGSTNKSARTASTGRNVRPARAPWHRGSMRSPTWVRS